MFDTEQIRDIKSKIDILDLIEEYVELKRSGSIYWGLCPFHEDSTPSFSVSPHRGAGIWKCWSGGSCGSGDVFSFYMKKHKVDFNTAVIDLARKYDISIQISDTLRKEYELKSLYYKVNEDAVSFYESAIRFNPRAKKYLESRRILPQIANRFRIGSGDMIKNHLSQVLLKKYSKDDLIAVGLLTQAEGLEYETFRNRLMIPIQDDHGRVVGFTARALDDQTEPKYKNTKETLIFNKRDLLYGLNYAKQSILDYNSVILTEGQFDVIRAMSVGVNNIVAISGKEMTESQAIKLGKLTSNFILCFDNDNAGKSATDKAYKVIRENTKFSNIKVVNWGDL